MSLSTYYLGYGRHVARLRRRRRRRAYAPTSNTASHDNHEKINSWVLFPVLSYMNMELRLAALRAAGTPLSIIAFKLEIWVICVVICCRCKLKNII